MHKTRGNKTLFQNVNASRLAILDYCNNRYVDETTLYLFLKAKRDIRTFI